MTNKCDGSADYGSADFGDHEPDMHAYHSGRDSYGRQIRPGTYMMTQPGNKPVRVEVTEDDISGELAFVATVDGQQVNQRIEDCARDVTFSRLDTRTADQIGAAEGLLERIRVTMGGLDEARRDLIELEKELAELLGARVGDGSAAAEAVQSYARDGMGTPYDLFQHSEFALRSEAA